MGRRLVGPVRRALDSTLKTLTELGRIEAVDGALVALCRSTASALDKYPERSSLVKEYRECLVLLAGLGADGGDELDRLLGEFGATMGDAPTS